MVFDGRIRTRRRKCRRCRQTGIGRTDRIGNVYMEQVGTFGDLERDPGERVISVAYYALVNVNEYDRELVQQHNAHWTK